MRNAAIQKKAFFELGVYYKQYTSFYVNYLTVSVELRTKARLNTPGSTSNVTIFGAYIKSLRSESSMKCLQKSAV